MERNDSFSAEVYLAVLDLLRGLVIDTTVKGIFTADQKTVVHNFKLVPILGIKNMPEERKDMSKDCAQDVIDLKDDVSRLLAVERQKEILPRP